MYVRPVAACMTHLECTQKNCICIDTTSRYSERQFPVSPAVAYMVWEREHDRVYCHSRKAIGTALGTWAFFLLVRGTTAARCKFQRVPTEPRVKFPQLMPTFASLYGKASHRIICTGRVVSHRNREMLCSLCVGQERKGCRNDLWGLRRQEASGNR